MCLKNPRTPCAQKSEYGLFWGKKSGAKEVWIRPIEFQITYWGLEKTYRG